MPLTIQLARRLLLAKASVAPRHLPEQETRDPQSQMDSSSQSPLVRVGIGSISPTSGVADQPVLISASKLTQAIICTTIMHVARAIATTNPFSRQDCLRFGGAPALRHAVLSTVQDEPASIASFEELR
ncbi:hypothetical protein [Rhizobium laguerreae]|uniref:hypothetical protein n=1 Tax=Rhizobium laguerreae TaxID=1076926 RepID=UPI001FE3145E|nr:hypothetical protein [Rhizobium laguerreae]